MTKSKTIEGQKPEKDYIDGVGMIVEAGNKIYDMKSDKKKDKNFYKVIMAKAEGLNVESAKSLRELFLKEEPMLESKVDIVQRVIISNVLLTYLYTLKAVKKGVNITNLIVLVPTLADDDTWLTTITDRLIPNLINKRLI